VNRPVLRLVVFALLALLAVLASGCGNGTIHLSREEYDRLPHDSRQEIFDAENDLVIARNRQDDAVERKVKTDHAISEIEQRWKKATTRLTASGQGGRISQARKVFDTHKAYLSMDLDVAEATIKTTAVGTDVSRARLQLVRARQLARIGRVTLASLKPLEDNVTSLENQLKSATAAESSLRTKAQSQLDAWKAAEDEYARASGDYDTGVWAE
jgi:hypothetical protein